MKTLLEYVQAQKKEYSFRLKFAVPVTAEMLEKLETSLGKFDVKKVGQPKKTIMQGRPMDFAAAGPGEIYIVEVTTEYPATREAVQDVVARSLCITPGQIVVRTEDEPLETDREEKELSGEALLTQEYEKLEHGDLHSDESLQKQHKEHKSKEFEYAAKSETKADKGPVYDTPDTLSPVGSTKNKKPEPKSAAR